MMSGHLKWLTVMLVLLAGCVATPELFHGWKMDKEHILSITSNSQNESQWKTFDVELDYRVKKSGNVLNIEGTASLSQHYQLMYAQVNNLQIYLFLVDAKGRVVETVSLATLMFGSTEDRLDFSRTVGLSDDVTGIAFGYRGVASEMEDQAHFDLLPVKAHD